jgi:hypothetical protein
MMEREPPMYRLLVCLFWGVVITATLTIAVFVFDAPAILLWQVGLLVTALPPHNIGTPEQPFYEGTPVQLIAIPLGILIGVPIYAFLSFLLWLAKEKMKNRGTP